MINLRYCSETISEFHCLNCNNGKINQIYIMKVASCIALSLDSSGLSKKCGALLILVALLYPHCVFFKIYSL